MTNDEVRELLQHTADCLLIEAGWWKNCAMSDRHNRDIGLFAKGIEIGYQRSAKWLNEQAGALEGDTRIYTNPPDGLVMKGNTENLKKITE